MRPEDPTRPDAAPRGAGLILLLLLTLAAYAALALAGFVFDDEPVVRDNTLTGDWRRWPEVFAVDLWEVSGTGEATGHYRPLMLLSLVIDRALYGLSTAGHHLHSVAWHLAAVCALYALLRRLELGRGALVGATLFALHPLQSEAVSFISARNDPMVAVFVLLATLTLLPRQLGPRALAGGGLLCLAALLSKETGVLVAPLLLLLDLARWGRPGSGWRYLPPLLALLAYLSMRTLAGITSNPMTEVAHWELVLNNLHQLAAHSALRILWPWPLTVGHSLEYLHLSSAQLALGLGGGLALAGLLSWAGGRLAVAGLLAAGMAFAPAILAIAARGQLGERYYYLSMAGVALALAAAWPKRWSPLGMAPFVLLSLLALHLRLPDWASTLTMWQAAERDARNSYTITGLAHAWNLAGQPEQACPLFFEALNDPVVYTPACFPAVNCPLKQGLVSRAVMAADKTLSVCPPEPELIAVQALSYAHFGLWEQAQERLRAGQGKHLMGLAVTEAALALRAGDTEHAEALRRDWGEEGDEVLARAAKVLEVAQQAEAWRAGAQGDPE